MDGISQGVDAGECVQAVCLHMEPCSRTLLRWMVVVLLGCVLYYSGLNIGRLPLIPARGLYGIPTVSRGPYPPVISRVTDGYSVG